MNEPNHSTFPSDNGGRMRDSLARLEAALAAGGIATWVIDPVTDRIVADASMARLFSVSPEEAATGSREPFLRAIHPDDRARAVAAVQEAIARLETYEVEYRVLLPNGSHRWVASRGRVERDAAGQARSVTGVMLDITERIERYRRERFLAELAERTRELTDPEAVIADAVRSTGEFLGVSRCVFVDIDIAADSCVCHPDYCADESIVSMAGTFPISDFGATVAADYGAGRAVRVEDVHTDRAQVPEESVAAYESLSIRAHVGVPVVHSAKLVSCIGVHSATPRRWTSEEVELLQAVVERTWLTVEVLRQAHALRREAEERRGAHERTARILESIADGFITLDAEWRFTYINDQAARIIQRTQAEVMGRDFWEVFPEAVGTAFEHQYRRAAQEGGKITFEDYFPPLNAWFEVRAYPSADGLSVFYQDVSERKTMEAERERIAERERNIARQLQAALTPSVPEHIPGMALAKHYEAALAEAGVGGDFYDVFPLGKGCTALVVGDLSGKGLEAASQVATVRNMLRYALFHAPTVAGAVSDLNALLAEQGLLTGFATLFVGAYDSGTGTLTYVNCGQEPALVRQASGPLEFLAPTGPVLGSFESAVYEERILTLLPGDSLAIFTDGLTEVGRSRRSMLGIEGMSALLEHAPRSESESAEAAAKRLAEHLMAGVDAAGQGGVMRDDMCLLVGIVE